MKTIRLFFSVAFSCVHFGNVLYLPEGMFSDGTPLVFLMMPIWERQQGRRKGRK